MSAEHERLKEILAEAAALATPEGRRSYLDAACGDDADLRTKVDGLLKAHERAGDFLEEPVFPSADEPIGEGPGNMIGPYKLLEQIGEGGFGRVWMAEQIEPMKRLVALKIVKLGMDTHEILGRFESERQALAMMEHPNIAKVLDGGATDTGRPYFVMELVRGVPITEFCDANQLAPRARLDLFRKVCQAVQHAHQKGVIHRDLKPSNILVTVHDDEPVPKVIDFGVAKALQARLTERTLFTRFNQWVGTPTYMSPEQAGLGSLDVDTRSDVYSLGAILYELLTGHTPFDGEKLREGGYDALLRTIREEDAPRVSTRLSYLPREELRAVADLRGESAEKLGRELKGELDWILLKALDRNRSRRYETANALARDLERFSKGEPISAAPPSFAYQAGKYLRKHRGLAVATAVFALLLVAGTAGIIWWATRPGPEPFQRTGDPLLATLVGHEDVVWALVYSSSRQVLASASTDGEIKLWDAEAGELLTTFREHGDSVWGLAISPYGESLASVDHDGKILLWDVETRKLRSTFKISGTKLSLAFSPDGRSLAAYGRGEDSCKRWDLKTGKLLSSFDLQGLQLSRFAFSPDGSLLAFCAALHGGGILGLLDVESGESLWSRRGDPRQVCSLAFSPDGKTLATGNADHSVKLWDVAAGRVRLQLPASHSTWVCSGAFSPDGKMLASGSIQVWLWDVESHRRVATHLWHHGPITSLVFYADGRTLASASKDRDIKIWDVQAAVLALAERERKAQEEAAAEEEKSWGPRVAYDEFDGKPGLDWKILNPDPSHYSFDKRPGTLTIRTQKGAIWTAHKGARNLVLVENPLSGGGDFMMTTCLDSFRPKNSWQQAGLLCYDDEDNYIKWVCRNPRPPGVGRLEFSAELEGSTRTRYGSFTSRTERLWLRITKRGNLYIAFFSTDGLMFERAGALPWGTTPPGMCQERPQLKCTGDRRLLRPLRSPPSAAC